MPDDNAILAGVTVLVDYQLAIADGYGGLGPASGAHIALMFS